VVLAAAAGWSLQEFAGLTDAVVPALLIGLVAASLVPVKGGCPVGRLHRDRERSGPGDGRVGEVGDRPG
jgi:hypothetical protein